MDRLDARIADKALLQALSRHLEDHALALDEPVSILSTFQTAARFTPTIADRYAALTARHPFVAALAVGLGTEPAPGVRGAAINPGSALAREWTLTIVGHHYCVALIAREIPSPDSQSDTGVGGGRGNSDGRKDGRRFEYALTHDRTHTVDAAHCLTRAITAHRM